MFLPLACAYLRPSDVARARQVCVAWRNVRAAWSTLELGRPNFAKLVDLCIPGAIRKTSNYAPLFNVQFAEVAKFTNLEEIDVFQCQITDECLHHLAAHTQLESLKLSWCTKLHGANFNVLPVSLISLDLSSSTFITDLGIAQLLHLQNLKTLNLSHCLTISDACFSSLAAMNLISLDLNFCNHVTDEGIKELGRIKSLKRLTLYGTVTDAGLAHVSQVSRLVLNSCSQVTGRTLGSFPNLEILHVWFCTSMVVVQSHTLKDLSLNGNEVISTTFSCKNLKILHVSLCHRIDNIWLSQIDACPQLQSLTLNDCDKIDDAGMFVLDSLPCLENLEISRCKLVSKPARVLLLKRHL